ncbi:MATE family efflux transporter [Anaerofustis stercorihominis]|uniref:MATE family efflux transporter n=2 Tax=Anaerofustis stercorihominis TaxID=214853 RepID=UPI00210B9500|nr:MATE family efflux transporter [Anaerofustis stercorihominis]MCQ4796313.1 MATE family efflux transporter [Anaerofustis stercorihominis]
MLEKNNENKIDLGSGNVGKLIFTLAVPAIIAQIFSVLYNIINRMFIGHIEGVGTLALTGVGVCFPILILVYAFAALTSMGGAPRAAIMLGKNDKNSAEKILGSCTIGTIISGIIMTIMILLFGEKLLFLFGASTATIEYALSYLRVYSLGIVFIQIAIGLNTFIMAQGFAVTGMISILIGAILNMVLDPIFIFMLDMGVKGAALATVTSQFLSALWVLYFLNSKKSFIKIKKEYFKIDFKIYLPCLLLGLSPFVMQVTESAIAIIFNSSLLKYGGDIAVGSMTILNIILQFYTMPIQGFTQGAQPVISFNYGAGNADRVKRAFLFQIVICTLYSLLLWCLTMFLPKVFITLFTSDTALITYTQWSIKIYMAVMFLIGIQISCQQTFVALSNAKVSLFLAVFRKIVLLIPLIFILPKLITNNVLGVFLAQPITDVIAVSVTVILFIIEVRKTLMGIKE